MSPLQSLSALSQTSGLLGNASGSESSQSVPVETYPAGASHPSAGRATSPKPSPSASAYHVDSTPSSIRPSQLLSRPSQISTAPGLTDWSLVSHSSVSGQPSQSASPGHAVEAVSPPCSPRSGDLGP